MWVVVQNYKFRGVTMKLNEMTDKRGIGREERKILEQLDNDVRLAVRRFVALGVPGDEAVEMVRDHLRQIDISVRS